MKPLPYILLAAVLASGPAFAQPGMQAHADSFALAGQTATAPAHAAAVKALKAFARQTAAPSSMSHHLATPATRLSHGKTAPPAGFPLAIDSMASLKQARIGWGFAVNDVKPSKLLDGDSLEKAAQPIGQWRFAIMVHGEPVGLVTMARTEAGWQAVSFGGAGLSRDINNLVERYGKQPGTQLRYVRVPQATADFIELTRNATQPQYVPLQAARSSLHLDTAARRVGADLIPDLREAVKRNMAVTH